MLFDPRGRGYLAPVLFGKLSELRELREFSELRELGELRELKKLGTRSRELGAS